MPVKTGWSSQKRTNCEAGLELFTKKRAPPCVSESLRLVTPDVDVVMYRRI